MAEHNDTGIKGEQLAADFLTKKGYVILETNWRFKSLEADIIALFDNTVIIVEVKTRKSNYFGEPETFVNKQKRQNLRSVANEYMVKNEIDMDVRFDIVSIILNNKQLIINHIEGSFLFG